MIKLRVLKYPMIVIMSLLLALTVQAQDLLKGKDLSQVRVDQLSDSDIEKLKAQLAASNLTIDQAEQMAMAKGMSPAEFVKLKQRLSFSTTNNNATGRLKAIGETGRTKSGTDSLSVPRYNGTKPQTLIDSMIFGSELYTSIAPSFEPNLNLATPVNYILGPGDVLSVAVYGVQIYEGELPVSAEGVISIPNVGQIKVAGLSIEAATQRLKGSMGRIYSTLNSGASKLSVTLSKIRSIKVNVIGSVFPGTYTVSSLANVFNVLYLAGGPRQLGSFREIELVRQGEPNKKIDLYRFLLTGDQFDNIGLKDNDVIRIPAYKTRVELNGQVKRPGIYEVLPGEYFSNVLEFASGFTDTAYMASVKVYQRSDKERKVQDLPASEYGQYHPHTGDLFVASKILNRFQNRIKISGAVFRPDTYQLTPGLKVADLIRKADGLREDAYTGRAQIIRLEEDLTRSVLSFDIRRALAGDASNNLELKREDEILISSISELRDLFKVTIQGEIRLPGEYDYVNQLSLKDLILQAGGLSDAAYKTVEIARLIRRDSISPTDNRTNTVIEMEISGDLSGPSTNIPIQPFDVVTVRRKAGYSLPQSVIVNGQVQHPGPYALISSMERVSDLLARAGGYTPDANPAGAYIRRYKTDVERQQAEQAALRLQKNVKNRDSAKTQQVMQDISRDYDQIPLDMASIRKRPGSVEDVVLRAKDELYIPKFDGQVKVSGAVLMGTQVPFKEGNSIIDYVGDAGGYGADAWRRKIYIVYANGKGATTKHFLFFKFYPKVLPGSELVVPKRPDRKSMTTGEIIGISSALASLAGVVIAILRL